MARDGVVAPTPDSIAHNEKGLANEHVEYMHTDRPYSQVFAT